MFPQVGVAEGVEYTSRSFTYHHASLAHVDHDDHYVGGGGSADDDDDGDAKYADVADDDGNDDADDDDGDDADDDGDADDDQPDRVGKPAHCQYCHLGGRIH